MKPQTIHTFSAEETERLGELIGSRLKGGEVLELNSDLGGGKTTFVRGLARGAGSTDRVSSPSFTISKVYQAGKLEIHHFDFYRLESAGVVSHELAEVVQDPFCVTIVEWPGAVENVLPKDRVRIEFAKLANDSRMLQFMIPPELSYLTASIFDK